MAYQEEEKTKVVRKIEFVSKRIVQGMHATTWKRMGFYYAKTVVTVLLSAGGAAGLIKTQYDFSQKPAGTFNVWNWETVAAILSLGAGIVLELFRLFAVDKTALQAISARESFSRLRKALENALENADPRPELNQVVLEAKTLGTNFHDVLDDPDITQETQKTELAKKLVSDFQSVWVFPEIERKGETA